MDERIALKNGTIIDNKYIIKSEIGRGGSCIVYDAEYMDHSKYKHSIRIKELYPYFFTCKRIENKVIVENDKRAVFSQEKDNFVKAYENNLLFYSDSQLMNYTVDARDICEENNTVYVVYSCDSGTGFDKYKPHDIRECIQIVLATARAILQYHNKGYLHLDIKPSNVLVLNGSRDLVILFDFDSVCSKQELKNDNANRISYSEGYSAPEQVEYNVDRISECTDIYALSAMLYVSLFGKCPGYEERRHGATFDFSEIILDTHMCDDQFFDELSLFFSRTLCANTTARYQNVDSFINKLEKILYLASPLSDVQIELMLEQVEEKFNDYKIDEIMDSLEILASKNVGRAIYFLTEIYSRGLGHVKKNMKLASYYRKKGTSSEDCVANINGAYLYPADSEQRKEVFNSLENNLEQMYTINNDYSAGYELACFYYTNNNSTGRELLEELDSKKFWRASYKLGVIYEEENNVFEAMKYYEKLSNIGVGDASYGLGMIYENDSELQNLSEAANYYELAYLQGCAEGANKIGVMISKDEISDYHKLESIEWYRKAFDAGDSINAAYNLAHCYDNGIGVVKNSSRAYELYEIAANNGQIRAMFKMGQLYKKRKLFNDAVYWFSKAADLNDEEAMFVLANMYIEGDGVVKNIDKGLQYMEKSAIQGYAWAEYELGRTYHQGELCEVDESKSIYWLKKAREHKIDRATIDLCRWFDIGDGVTYMNDIFRSARYEFAVDESKATFDSIKDYCKSFISIRGLKYFENTLNLRYSLGIPDWEEVIFAYDNSLLHNGKNGFAMTIEGFYYRGAFDRKVTKTSFIEFVNGELRIVDNRYIYSGDNKLAIGHNEDMVNDLRFLYSVVYMEMVVFDN